MYTAGALAAMAIAAGLGNGWHHVGHDAAQGVLAAAAPARVGARLPVPGGRISGRSTPRQEADAEGRTPNGQHAKQFRGAREAAATQGVDKVAPFPSQRATRP